jgi:hypothetical protein
MRQLLLGTAFVAGLMGSAALAADMTAVIGVQSTRIQTTQPIARLADQGLGYSVLHDVPGIPQRGYRVHVTCAIDESFMQTYCPTPVYVSACPRARIICGGGAQEVREVRALRLKY